MTTALCNTHGLIAREAVDQLAAAVQTILQLEELLKAVRPGLGEHTAPARLIELGIYAAGDQANGFDYAREDLQQRLQACAPQEASSPVRGAPPVDGPCSTVGERLVLARTWAGLTQSKLAKKIGIEQTSISQLERGESQRSTYVAELARACGVSIDWLAFGPEVPA